jgi:hypothetical protein
MSDPPDAASYVAVVVTLHVELLECPLPIYDNMERWLKLQQRECR